jgi:RimJ/RimL family protein N-acetyltransferase
MVLDELELMDLHLDALYRRDDDGKLRTVNEPEPPWPPAPRFWLGRTSAGNRWSVRYDLPAAIVSQLERLLDDEPVAVDLEPEPRNREAIMALLEQHAPISSEYRGPAYWIPAGQAVRDSVVIVTPANAAVLERWFKWLVPCTAAEECGPVAAVLDGGDAVAYCYCARITAQACEAGVETVEAYRGRGYATAAVGGWAVAVRETGRLPMYSTWWENLASQAVARKLEMVQYGEDWSIN